MLSAEFIVAVYFISTLCGKTNVYILSGKVNIFLNKKVLKNIVSVLQRK